MSERAGRRSRRNRMEDDCARGSAPGGGLASRPDLGGRRLYGAPRRSLARRSRDPGQPQLCACETRRQRPSGAATAGLDWTSSGADRGAPRPANDAHTGRSRPQSQGGSQPPRSNGQAFDEARNPVTVAGHRRCRASGQVRPCWDQAFPCYSPLGSAAASAGRASRPLAASSPLGPAVASSYRSEGGRVPLGSVDWQ